MSAIFFSGHVPCKFFFIVIFFFRRGGGLKLGLYVFHHDNNFNLINIYSAKTLMFANFFNALLGLCIFSFLQILSPPPPPPRRSTGPSLTG